MARIGRVLAAAALLFAVLQAEPAFAKKPKSTPEERATAVRLGRELEANPLVADGPEKRYWLIEFYSRVPDIVLTICGNLLGPFPPEDHPFFPMVLTQSMFSAGTFVIEHPDKAKDEMAVQMAGMLGALKVYEIGVQADTEHRLPFLDDLLKRRDAGTLEAYLVEAVPEACKPDKPGKP